MIKNRTLLLFGCVIMDCFCYIYDRIKNEKIKKIILSCWKKVNILLIYLIRICVIQLINSNKDTYTICGRYSIQVLYEYNQVALNLYGDSYVYDFYDLKITDDLWKKR